MVPDEKGPKNKNVDTLCLYLFDKCLQQHALQHGGFKPLKVQRSQLTIDNIDTEKEKIDSTTIMPAIKFTWCSSFNVTFYTTVSSVDIIACYKNTTTKRSNSCRYQRSTWVNFRDPTRPEVIYTVL